MPESVPVIAQTTELYEKTMNTEETLQTFPKSETNKMKSKLPSYLFVLDVESIGLHGSAFAVGWVVIDTSTFTEVAHGLFASPRDYAAGFHEDREWVNANVPEIPPTHQSARHMRTQFWGEWCQWKDRGAWMVADCPWPVEARFLAECISDDRLHIRRHTEGPYPLLDVASVLFALGRDPLATYNRLENELPTHNPLADARQSARLLIEAMKISDNGQSLEVPYANTNG